MSETGNEQSLEWLVEILKETSRTESVRERMRHAGNVAFSLARLRSERQKVGFLPLPFGEYLHGLAKVAGIAVAPVLEWASIKDPSGLNQAEAARIGRLAHALGFLLEELLLFLRVGIAEQAGGAPLPMLAAHRGASAMATAPQCDRILRQLEAGWPTELRTEADAITAAASSGYRARAKEEFGMHG